MTSFARVITDTYTESRAKYVFGKVYDDFQAIYSRGFDYLRQHPDMLPDLKKALFYIASERDLKSFEIQFLHSSGDRAIEYEVRSDGSIYRDDDSGGINYWQIPSDAIFSVVVDLKGNEEVWNELQKLGWRRGGSFLDEPATDKGSFSKDGFGVIRKLKGPWDQ